MVPEIHSLLFNTFTTAADDAPIGGPREKAVSSEQLFLVAKMIYLAQLHSLIMLSWKSFREGLKKSAEEENESSRQLEIRDENEKAIQLEAEKRYVDSFLDSLEGKVSGRQASKFRFWQGAHQGENSALNLPV